jgi:hypothetical protein
VIRRQNPSVEDSFGAAAERSVASQNPLPSKNRQRMRLRR